MTYQTAFKAALNFTDALRPYCEKIIIAGSVRRMSAHVGDIDILAIPKKPSLTAFFSEARKHGRAMNETARDTRYFKLQVNDTHLFSYDIFLPQPFDWGRQLAIRTGPAEYSAHLAHLWSLKGFCGTDQGLLPKGICHQKKDGKWQVTNGFDPQAYRVEFPEEIDFFNFLGIEMPDPERRRK
jgi:DNA polymerase/3'-5' exonuclease PolX